MGTPAQIAASIANGRRSLGPVTDAGKQRSATNSLKHGLTAQRLIVPGECADEFADFVAEHFELYRPAGGVEIGLVIEIAGCSWRLRRAAAAESSAIRATMTEAARELNQTVGDPDDNLGRAFMALDETGFLSRSLPRHEARLARRRKDALMLLVQLQRLRQQTREADAVAFTPDCAADAEGLPDAGAAEISPPLAIAGPTTLPNGDQEGAHGDEVDTHE
jgi:hypothetical protein